MHIQLAITPEPILPMLQQHGADLLRWLLSLSRTPEPSRVPQPVRPDAPSRPHIAAAAALSHAPGIDAGRSTRAACLAWATSHIATCRDRRRHSQTTPPHGATRRGRRRRGKSGGPPRPRKQIRQPQGPVSATARQIRLGRVEPFLFRPDLFLPGTLHHSGIRPAPPSDHTPLARRSAFCAQRSGLPRNPDAAAGLKRVQRELLLRLAPAGAFDS